MIKAVVFDLDDTLYPEAQFVLSGFRAVGDWLDGSRSISGFFEKAEGLFENGNRGNIFNLALENLGVEAGPQLVAELVEVYRTHKPDLRMFEDAHWAIDFFSKDRMLGIITDGYLIAQRNKVEALQLDLMVDLVVCSDEYGRDSWKPSEAPYRKIMDGLAVVGSDCVYIADNPVKDFVTARKLGWQTIQICREDGEYAQKVPLPGYEADFKIESLLELKQLV